MREQPKQASSATEIAISVNLVIFISLYELPPIRRGFYDRTPASFQGQCGIDARKVTSGIAGLARDCEAKISQTAHCVRSASKEGFVVENQPQPRSLSCQKLPWNVVPTRTAPALFQPERNIAVRPAPTPLKVAGETIAVPVPIHCAPAPWRPSGIESLRDLRDLQHRRFSPDGGILPVRPRLFVQLGRSLRRWR